MKNPIKILLCLIMVLFVGMFVACGEDYNKLEIEFSAQSIELFVSDDKPKSYEFTIKNYFDFDAKFDFDIPGKIAKISDVKHIGKGVFTFDIIANVNSKANAELTIKIKGTQVQKTVPISVSLKISGFSPKQNLFVEKAENSQIDLNNVDNFIFEPQQTTQTKLSFTYNGVAFGGIVKYKKAEDEIFASGESAVIDDGVLWVNSNLPAVSVVATSEYNRELTQNVKVDIVDEVDVNKFTFGESYFDGKSNSEVNREKWVEFEDDNIIDFFAKNQTELILNDNTWFEKVLLLNCVEEDYLYDVSVVKKQEIDGETLTSKSNNLYLSFDGENEENGELANTQISGESRFKISASGMVDEEYVKITIYNKNYPANKKDLYWKITTKNIPEVVKINNVGRETSLELFDTDFANKNYNQIDIGTNISPVDINRVCITFNTLKGAVKTPINIAGVLEYLYIDQGAYTLLCAGDGVETITYRKFLDNLDENAENEDVLAYTTIVIDNASKNQSFINAFSIYGKQALNEDKLMQITISEVYDYGYGYSEQDGELSILGSTSNIIATRIYKGATKFEFAETYIDDSTNIATLYVQKGSKEYFGAEYDDGDYVKADGEWFVFNQDKSNDIYVGSITAKGNTFNDQIGCEVKQVYNKFGDLINGAISIEGKQVGTYNYTLKIKNGLTTKLRVIVCEELVPEEMYVYLEATKVSNIADFATKNNSLSAVTIKLVNNSDGGYHGILLGIKTNNDSDLYEISEPSVAPKNKEEGSESVFSALIVGGKVKVLVSGVEEGATLTIPINVYEIKDFKKQQKKVMIGEEEKLQTKTFEIKLSSIKLIDSVEFVASNKMQMQTSSIEVDVYNIFDLGARDSDLATINFNLNTKSGGENVDVPIKTGNPLSLPKRYIKIYFADNSNNSYTINGNEVKNGNNPIGTLTIPTDKNPEFKFNCDLQQSLNKEFSFIIFAEFEDYGNHSQYSIKINVKTYIAVDNVLLKNPCSTLYFDSLSAPITLYPYVYPQNATNQDIDFIISGAEISNSISLSHNQSDNSITLTYNGGNGGTGKLIMVPVSSYSNQTEYTKSISIPIIVADGLTQQTAIRVSIFEQFANICRDSTSLSQHYVLTQMIDCQGRTFNFGTLTGSIRGLNEGGVLVGGIFNYTISAPCGLFTEIGTNGLLENLTMVINFNMQTAIAVNNDLNFGGICNVNNGTIKNVNVVVESGSKVNIMSSENKNVYFGCVAGVNNGNILIDSIIYDEDGHSTENDKELASTLCATGELTAIFRTSNGSANSNFNIGFVAGKNSGTIKHLYNNIIRVDNYGTFVNGVIETNANSVGMLVGENTTGTIQNILAKGTIYGFVKIANNIEASESIGGLVGTISGTSTINNNTSRVYLRGNNTIGGLVGTVAEGGVDTTGITFNNVQAIDDAKTTGINTSLIILYGNTGSIGAICGKGSIVGTNNNAENYITRDLESGGNVNNPSKSTSKYYDVAISIDTDSGEISKISIDFVQKTLNEFIVGTEFMLEYYQAKDSSLQKYLQQYNSILLTNIKTKTTEVADVFSNQQEYVIVGTNGGVISANTNGKITALTNGTGILKIANALNQRDVRTINVYVTHKLDGIKLYADSSCLQEIRPDDSVFVNDFTYSNVYAKFYANDKLIDGNASVELVDNQDFDLKFIPNENLNVNIANKTISIIGINNLENIQSTIYFYGEYIYKNSYVLKYDPSEDNPEKADLNSGKIVTGVEVSDSKNCKNLNVSVDVGVVNLRLDKNQIENLSPRDEASFKVYFNSKTKQQIQLVLSDEYGNQFKEVLGNDINIQDEGFTSETIAIEIQNSSEQTIFVGSKKIEKIDDYYYCVTYTFILYGDADIIASRIKYISNNQLTVKFIANGVDDSLESLNRGKLITSSVSYGREEIENVLYKNFDAFSNGENLYLWNEEKNRREYLASESLITSDIAVAGDTNTLKIYVNSCYSNFDYIDITCEDEQYKALFTLLSHDNDAYIRSSNAIYLNNGVRVNTSDHSKNEITIQGNMLVIALAYRFDSEIAEFDKFVINVKFLDEKLNPVLNKQGEAITSSLTLSVKQNTAIGIDIVDATKYEDVEKDEIKYYVAKGYRYLTNINYNGYDSSEVIKQTGSGIWFEEIDGKTYLNVSSFIDYQPNQEGFETYITIYGQKIIDRLTVKGKSTTIKIIVVDYILYSNTIQGLFGNQNVIDIACQDKVYLQQKIADLITVKQYSPSGLFSISKLKESIKTSSNVKITFTYKQHSFSIEDQKDFSCEDFYCQNIKVEQEGGSFNKLMLTPYAIYQNAPYTITVKFGFKYEEGRLVLVDNSEQEITFNFNVYSVSTRKNPTPVSTLKELLNVKDGGNYRLVSDIEISKQSLRQLGYDQYTPITALVNYFDGNGHVIYFGGTYVYNNIQNFALFESLKQDALIENVCVCINGATMLSVDNLASDFSVNIGLIVAVNNGILYNCEVTYKPASTLTVVANSKNESYYGSVCAINQNGGNIVNSRTKISVLARGVVIGGFVAENYGNISSCYVKDSLIINDSNTTRNTTGGFVQYNKGNIFASYIQGGISENYLYSNTNSYKITSSNRTGAFVLINESKIEDCYADIPLDQGTEMAGFAYKNTGSIKRSFSTCLFKEQKSTNYPFVCDYQNGSFEDCFFLQDALYGFNNNISTLNNNLQNLGLCAYNFNKFTSIETYDYLSMSLSENRYGVWTFFNVNSEGSEEVKVNYSNYFSEYDRDANVWRQTKMICNRPQLVSANVIAYSHYEWDKEKTEINTETGEVVYTYINKADPFGSSKNPFALTSAKDLEEIIFGARQSTVCNYYIRLICDVDYYKENIYSSNLYKKVFVGVLDGNGFTISNYAVNTTATGYGAGFVSQLGDNGGYESVIKNVNFNPACVNTPNITNVGGVAGVMNGAGLYNVSIKNSLYVIGKSSVGGVVGRTANYCEIINVYCDSYAKSTNLNLLNSLNIHDNANDICFNKYFSNSDKYSYAGGIIGILTDDCLLKNVSVADSISAQGMIAGLIAGGIGKDAKIVNAQITLSSTSTAFLSGYVCSGFIVGHSQGGIIENASVNASTLPNALRYGFDEQLLENLTYSDIEVSNVISTSRNPDVFGGIVGYLTNGGSILNCNVKVEIIAKNIEIIGGIAGLVEYGIIKDCNVITAIEGNICVGGIVGANFNFSTEELNLENNNVCFVNSPYYICNRDIQQYVVNRFTCSSNTSSFVDNRCRFSYSNDEDSLSFDVCLGIFLGFTNKYQKVILSDNDYYLSDNFAPKIFIARNGDVNILYSDCFNVQNNYITDVNIGSNNEILHYIETNTTFNIKEKSLLNVQLSDLIHYNNAIQEIENSNISKQDKEDRKLIVKIALQIAETGLIEHENGVHLYDSIPNYKQLGNGKIFDDPENKIKTIKRNKTFQKMGAGVNNDNVVFSIEEVIDRINNNQTIYTDCCGFVRMVYLISALSKQQSNPTKSISDFGALSYFVAKKGDCYTTDNLSQSTTLYPGDGILDRLTTDSGYALQDKDDYQHIGIYLYKQGNNVVYVDQSCNILKTSEYKTENSVGGYFNSTIEQAIWFTFYANYFNKV